MSSLTTKMLLLLISLLLTTTTTTTTTTATATGNFTLSLSELLKEYNIPAFPLPPNIKSYTFNRATGEFTVYLHDALHISTDSFRLKCKPTISGVISKGSLKKLEGVSAQSLGLVWKDVKEINRDGDTDGFHVVAVFSIKVRCGLQCNVLATVKDVKMKMMNLAKRLKY